MDIRTTYCMIDTKTYWWVYDLVGKLVGWRAKKNDYRPFLRQSSGRITFVLKRAGFVLFRNLQFIRWTLCMPWSTVSYTFKVHWFTCYSYSNRHLHGCFKNNIWQNVCSGNVAHPNWHLVNYNLKYVSCMCSFLVFIYLYSYLCVYYTLATTCTSSCFRGNLQNLTLSFQHMNAKYQTQIVRYGGEHFHLLCLLTGPTLVLLSENTVMKYFSLRFWRT